MAESFRFPKPIPRDTPAKIAVAMTENMRSLEVWLNKTLVPEAESGAADHGDLTGVGANDHHARYTDGEAQAAVAADIDTDIATHAAITGAHHAKYTDAEAVAAVAAEDDYVLNTGDTVTGTLTAQKFVATLTASYDMPATGQVGSLSAGTYTEMSNNGLYLYEGSSLRMWIVNASDDIVFYAADGSTESLQWDESESRWEFAARPYSTADGALLEVVGHNHDTSYLELDGTSTMTGDLDMGGNTIDDTTGKMISLYRNAVQSCANSDWTAVVWTTQESASGGAGAWDEVGGSNPSRITVDEDGVYAFVFQAYWDLSAGTNQQIRLYVNGVQEPQGIREDADDSFHRAQASGFVKLVSGDYIEMYVRHTEGVSADLRSDGTTIQVAKLA